MNEDLKLRGRSDNTRATYLRCAATFVRHYRRSPMEMGREQVRDFLLHLVEDLKRSPSTYNVYAASLKFLYGHTLGRPEQVAWVGQMRVPRRLPAILSAEEIESLLAALGSLRMQAIAMAAYGAGLRVSEALHLRFGDIDSQRMVIHVQHGKGDRDRYTMLPKRLLSTLRAYYKEQRPPGPELFPGPRSGTVLSREAVGKALKRAAAEAKIAKRVHAHCLRHAFATHLLEVGTDLQRIAGAARARFDSQHGSLCPSQPGDDPAHNQPDRPARQDALAEGRQGQGATPTPSPGAPSRVAGDVCSPVFGGRAPRQLGRVGAGG